jgi:hypothetical protein
MTSSRGSAAIDVPLKLRPSGLGSGIDKDRPDYTIITGEWEIGRIYETRGLPEHLRWFWSMSANGPMTRSGRVETLEEAKAQFQKSWDAWKAWAKLGALAFERTAPNRRTSSVYLRHRTAICVSNITQILSHFLQILRV